MPTVFDEITGEIMPQPATESGAQPQTSGTPQPDLTEALRHELQLARERERRLVAD